MNWMIAFFACFMMQWKHIYFANIVFVIMIGFNIIKNRGGLLDRKGSAFLIIYLIWVIFSMILYLPYKFVDFRNIIQLLYNFQYIFWVLSVNDEKGKLRSAMRGCSKVLAISIVGAWILDFAGTKDILFILVHNRMWGEKLFGGWPNGTVLPLIYGLYLELKNEKRKTLPKLMFIFLYYFSAILTTSRTGIVGGFALIIYFIMFRRGVTLKMVSGFMLLIGIMLFCYQFLFSNDDTGIVARMMMVGDRINILQASLEYIKLRPFSGYGGNTFDYIYEILGSQIAPWNWGHTHNTVLELLLRHGVIGLITFCMYVGYLFRRIKSRDEKFMFILMWGLSLMQIFLKDFIFLIIIWLLIPSDTKEIKKVCKKEFLMIA